MDGQPEVLLVVVRGDVRPGRVEAHLLAVGARSGELDAHKRLRVVAHVEQSLDVVAVRLREIGEGQRQADNLLPDGWSEAEVDWRARADGDAHEHAEEAEHVEVNGGGSHWVDDEAVAVHARVLAPVGRLDQKRD